MLTENARTEPANRRQFIQLGAGLLAYVAVGCSRGRERPLAGLTITVLYPPETESHLFSRSPSQFLVFLPLVARNAKGELEGRLAESWEHSADYRTWTVYLRKGVRWHDGVPVTAQDVKFTLDLLQNPAVLSYRPATAVTVLNDETCSITTQSGIVGTPLDDWTVFFPKHLLERLPPAAFWTWEFWKHPVGDGPYRFLRSVPQTMVELEANPDFYQGERKVQRVVLKFRDASGAGALTELLSGDVDAIPYANPTDVLRLGRDPRFKVYYQEVSSHFRMIGWNNRKSLFPNPDVRRALTLAIDHNELRQILNLPAWIPTFDVLPTPDQVRRRQTPTPLPYDPGRAKVLLDKAGWKQVGANRERNGQLFVFTMLVADDPGFKDIAIFVQARLRRIGVQMNILTLEEHAVRERARNADFDAAITLVGDEWNVLWFASLSYSGYANPGVASLLERARRSVNPDEVDDLYRKCWASFQADLPATFLFPTVLPTIVNRRVEGLSSPFHADPVWDAMEGVSVEEFGRTR